MNKEEMKDTTQWFTQPEYWGLHPKTKLTLIKRHLTDYMVGS